MMGPIKSSPPASPQVGQPLCLPGKSKICRCYGLHLEILGSSIINPFRSNLITQIFIWKHSSFLSLLLRDRVQVSWPSWENAPPAPPSITVTGWRNSSKAVNLPINISLLQKLPCIPTSKPPISCQHTESIV